MPKKVRDVESEGLPFSELESVGLCACGATELFVRPKDARYTKAGWCGDHCKTVYDQLACANLL